MDGDCDNIVVKGLPRISRKSPYSDEVIIVGAGIVGICCGLSLLESGVAVTMIDRDIPGQATSSGNAGVVSPWSNVPQCMPGLWKNVPKWLLDPNGPVRIRPRDAYKVLPWALRFLANSNMQMAENTSDAMAALNASNIDLYRHHLRGTGSESLIQDSFYIHVFRDAAKINLKAPAWRIRARHGTPMKVISREELLELEPSLSRAYQGAIIIKDQARLTLPAQLGAVLAEKFEAQGGKIVRATAKAINTNESRTWNIETSAGPYRAQKLVLTAGAWSSKLLEPLGIKFPLQVERGYCITFKHPGVSLNNSIMEADRFFICSSMQNGIRSAGTSEFTDLDTPPNYRRAQNLIQLTKDLLPDLNINDVVEGMGNRPSFPDNLPCIGEISALPGLLAAFGHSHWGMSMAPQTGRIIADLTVGKAPNIDISPYRADRFL